AGLPLRQTTGGRTGRARTGGLALRQTTGRRAAGDLGAGRAAGAGFTLGQTTGERLRAAVGARLTLRETVGACRGGTAVGAGLTLRQATGAGSAGTTRTRTAHTGTDATGTARRLRAVLGHRSTVGTRLTLRQATGTGARRRTGRGAVGAGTVDTGLPLRQSVGTGRGGAAVGARRPLGQTAPVGTRVTLGQATGVGAGFALRQTAGLAGRRRLAHGGTGHRGQRARWRRCGAGAGGRAGGAVALGHARRGQLAALRPVGRRRGTGLAQARRVRTAAGAAVAGGHARRRGGRAGLALRQTAGTRRRGRRGARRGCARRARRGIGADRAADTRVDGDDHVARRGAGDRASLHGRGLVRVRLGRGDLHTLARAALDRHDQADRHVHGDGDARVAGGVEGRAQPDGETVPFGEPADHEQAHVAGGLRAGLGGLL